MIHIPRHAEILKLLSLLRTVSVGDFAQRLEVSEVTIRKDLAQLEEMGCLIRTRGGAQIAEDTRILKTIEVRQRERIEFKRSIARKARDLIREGETIYLDAGSTCLLLAKELGGINLRVVTNSIDVMVVLSAFPEISLISLGGSYRREAGSFVGPMAIEALRMLHIETCFLGTTGFSSRGIFSSQNLIEAQLKQKVLEVSKRRVVLADSAKFGREAFSIFARAGDVDVLISDSDFAHEKELRALGIEVVAADHP
ncbi:MAG: DeoR/GlpR family DNA-binding transcription regulator [Spirochaetes bacterium]|nr:DeoR/GlpR family DNA-binding transcription regulator [Spirochaetota bacterium]MBU1080999.1 DeoR/GlpR family DNA-binding transcription regulator [Spirochaetota bacterium]